MVYRDSIIGFEPCFNTEITVKPGLNDEGESIQIDYTRQFNIQDQMDCEFWYQLRDEFWPDID